jgi:hypothetical protein
LIAFSSCQKKENNENQKSRVEAQMKEEFFSSFTSKETFVLEAKTDTLSLFFYKGQLNRIEVKTLYEPYDDGLAHYERQGYHFSKDNFFDGMVYISDTLKKKVITDYPLVYEERYDFYRKDNEISYTSDGKKTENYLKTTEKVGYRYEDNLLAVDLLLSKISFQADKFPKPLYTIKDYGKKALYASQDSITLYNANNFELHKKIQSNVPFNYLRNIKVKKVGNTLKYFAKISLKDEGVKYIDLKEIQGIQSVNPHLEKERFVAVTKGLKLYWYSDLNNYGDEEQLLTVLPLGAKVEIKDTLSSELIENGKKGFLIRVYYDDVEGETLEGVLFSGALSLKKP